MLVWFIYVLRVLMRENCTSRFYIYIIQKNASSIPSIYLSTALNSNKTYTLNQCKQKTKNKAYKTKAKHAITAPAPTPILPPLPPLPPRTNGFQKLIPAAAPVEMEGDDVDVVGAIVETGCGVVDVEMVVGAVAAVEGDEEEEVDAEEVVAAAGTGGVVFDLGTQLAPAVAAVPVRCAQLFFVLLLLSSPGSGFSWSS